MAKNEGIDERVIKCCCNNNNCAEGGISVEENKINFHWTELINEGGSWYNQRTKAFYIDKKGAKELIELLKNINFK